MLGDHALSNLVIILSACFSGSFIDDLAAPDRIVITASAADRKSFGCEDGREWTYWGEAFFAQALSQTDDPREAFAIARGLVTGWETAQGYTPSSPQMDVGSGIALTLDAWLADRPDRKAELSR